MRRPPTRSCREPLERRLRRAVAGPATRDAAVAVRARARHGRRAESLAEGVLKPQIESLDAELVVLEEPYLAREESVN